MIDDREISQVLCLLFKRTDQMKKKTIFQNWWHQAVYYQVKVSKTPHATNTPSVKKCV